jgi:translation initiation factor 2B subunit (eIF-2B alpha/beta/delta family)
MLAKESKIPVVACCETYKFGDKIVLDAVTGNELGKSFTYYGHLIGADRVCCRRRIDDYC